MKLNLTALRRPLIGLGATLLAISGVAVSNVATRPASNGQEPVVQLAQPAADAETTTTTGPAIDQNVILDAATRAEGAAGRAETAAGRAEVAATRAETVATSTTTTTSGPGVVSQPIGTQTTTGPVEEPTTTTTTTPKQWVEVGRFHSSETVTGPPDQIAVTLLTGQIRVWSVFPNGHRVAAVEGVVWFGTDPVPAQSCPASAGNTGTIILWGNGSGDCPAWQGPWPTGDGVISAGYYSDHWHNLTEGGLHTSYVVVVEEYR